jgi:hypothetical protein
MPGFVSNEAWLSKEDVFGLEKGRDNGKILRILWCQNGNKNLIRVWRGERERERVWLVNTVIKLG